MMTPRVSVVIPVYDLGAYLPQAVESVAAQTYRDYEIVIIDDGSTDPATREVVDRYARSGTTRVLRTPNQGLAQARNHAITHARGAYVLPVDADDLVDPEFLARTVPVLDAEPRAGFVYTSVKVFGEHEAEWPAEPFDLPRLLTHNIVGLATALLRRQAWQEAGGYDPAMQYGFEDWDLFIRMAAAGWQGVPVPDVLTLYRRRPGSMLSACNAPDRRPLVLRQLVEKNLATYETNLVDVVISFSQQLFEAQQDAQNAHRHLTRVYRSRMGRVAGWIWSLRANPIGFCVAGVRNRLARGTGKRREDLHRRGESSVPRREES